MADIKSRTPIENYWSIFYDYHIPPWKRATLAIGAIPMAGITMLGSLSGCSDIPQREPDLPLDFPRDAGSYVPDATRRDATQIAQLPDAGLTDAGEICQPDLCPSGILLPKENKIYCASFERQELPNVAVPHSAISEVDIDQDGLKDIYLLNDRSPNLLLRNTGDGFSEASRNFGLHIGGDHLDAAWGDYDQDGDVDLFLIGENDTQLLENQNGVYTARPDLLNVTTGGTTALWIGSNLLVGSDTGTRFFRFNASRGNFLDSVNQVQQITLQAGLEDGNQNADLVSGDYNGDGLADIYLVNKSGKNRLFEQQANGSFRSVEEEKGVLAEVPARTAAWVQIKPNQFPSLHVARAHQSGPNHNAINYFYQNTGGTFQDTTQSLGLHDPDSTSAITWGDPFALGQQVLFAGHWDQPNELYMPISENGEIVRYDYKAQALGLHSTGQTVGVIWLNRNGDPFLDLLVVMAGGAVIFFKNKTHEVKICDSNGGN